ncbi:GNAT family N-acetyltransferase [Flagellimonas sp. HMM57]|uniref:GNAT family N-acetyltransferase n=1 Tax=unclassified Flagellimonas TaxID=2644544 RepID=UPI0013D35876|nr:MULTISPECIES: GNAT family protein [unclassified Flagellimonas]UII77649.1 GNAT family N-acetyltransferase [Flagellimonas sp. HMM57]
MTIKVAPDVELRKLILSDATVIFKAIDSQRTYLGKWLPFVALTNEIKDTENFVNTVVNAPEDEIEYTFTIRVKNEFAGVIALKDIDALNKKTEIGYWLSEKFQKNGIVTKSVEKLCDFAFNDLNLNRVQIKCAVGNKPSINIPKRLGFEFEGVERSGELLTGNIFTDLEIYSKLKNDC